MDDNMCLNCKTCRVKKPNKFCSKTCSAIYNNSRRPSRINKLCLVCDEKCSTNKGQYCSPKCAIDDKVNKKINDWLIQGTEPGWTGKAVMLKPFIRTWLFSTRGEKCEECGWSIRHQDGSIVLEIDHIDGDAKNCNPNNLRILCPNCHSLTLTHRARNKNSSRNR